MKILVVYDSAYGNTEQIARAIAGALSPSAEVKILRVSETSPAELDSIDLLVIGSPTQGGRPTLATQELLDKITGQTISRIKVATFDTRFSAKWVGIFGYAAGRIAENLKKKGGNLLANPEPFFVAGKEGPLKEGELDRAATWAKGLIK